MKAAVYENYGSPSVIKIKELARPVPKDNEVLIRVYATTVNRTDCAMLRAKPFIMRFITGLFKPLNPILGTDFSGMVEAKGKEVSSFEVGDRVFGFDDSGVSSHAYYMSLSEDKAMAQIPDQQTYEQAAASIEGAHYAYNFINKVDIKAGQKVLVNGATGAIGSAAVQLLKYYGASVTAVGNTQNIALMRSLGAEKVIDYLQEDFTQTNDKYHYVFDTVGKSEFSKCKPILEAGGTYISSELGPYAQNPFLALTTRFFGDKKVVFPVPTDKKKSVLLIKKLCEEGKFEAVIDRRYALKDIVDAFRYVETGEKTGNVVITYEE